MVLSLVFGLVLFGLGSFAGADLSAALLVVGMIGGLRGFGRRELELISGGPNFLVNVPVFYKEEIFFIFAYMSIKKLHLYRNQIEKVVREFVGNEKLEIEVQSPQRIKYSVTFADGNELPAMVFVDYNQDGTTTIEDTRGRNKEYAVKLAEHIAKNTQACLYDTGYLYFTGITQEQFDVFVEYMTNCNATITSQAVANGNKYCICGEFGDMLYATWFNNGSILFQGHPCITFNNAITILSDLYPADMILEGLTKYYSCSSNKQMLRKNYIAYVLI